MMDLVSHIFLLIINRQYMPYMFDVSCTNRIIDNTFSYIFRRLLTVVVDYVQSNKQTNSVGLTRTNSVIY